MTIVQANQRRLSYCLNIQEIPIFLIDEKETVGMLKGSEYDFQFYKEIETQTQKNHEIFKGDIHSVEWS